MARNTNGIATFWDLAYLTVLIEDNVDPDENEEMVVMVARLMFQWVGKPLGSTIEETKILSQECPTKTEIETIYNEGNGNGGKWIWYINNVDNYASNQLVKYSDLRYEEIVQDSITVTPSSLSFSANPIYVVGSTNLTVVSSGNWSATFTSGTLSPSSGSAGTTKVLFSPGQNTATLMRGGSITFTCGSASDIVSWTQEAASVTTLSISPTSLTFSSLGTAHANNVTVTCSGSWTASTTTSWINLSKTSGTGNGSLTVSADRNTGTTSRSGTVTFKSGLLTRTLSVTQRGAITIKHYLTVSYTGSPQGNINVTAYIDGVIRPSVTSMEQNPIQICEITADDAGKSYTVKVTSPYIGETCVPNQFTGTLPATISSDYNVGTFLIQYT